MTVLTEVTYLQAPIDRCFQLALSIEVHLLGNVHFGEQAVAEPVRPGARTGGVMVLGDRVTWRARHFGVRQRLTSEITQYDRPHAFQDTMRSGAFAMMQHDHFFLAVSEHRTVMRDVFRYAAPFPVLGRLAERLVLDRYMDALLLERNRMIKMVAEDDGPLGWRRYLEAVGRGAAGATGALHTS